MPREININPVVSYVNSLTICTKQILIDFIVDNKICPSRHSARKFIERLIKRRVIIVGNITGNLFINNKYFNSDTNLDGTQQESAAPQMVNGKLLSEYIVGVDSPPDGYGYCKIDNEYVLRPMEFIAAM